jgi:hypothetical protein
MSKPQPTYWNDNGRFQREANALAKLVPSEGPVKGSPALERFRVASNCYYDLYNNGLCTRAAEFRRVFGFGGTRIAKSNFTDAALIAKVDATMDEIVLAAATEQAGTFAGVQS